MIESQYLRTLHIATDWDLSLVDQLKDLALIFYDWCWFEGEYERLDALSIEVLKLYGAEAQLTRALRERYNELIVERQKYNFDEDKEDDVEELYEAEGALVKELLTFHIDPDMYIVVHAEDEDHGDDAWFLCFMSDVEALGLDNSIRA